MTEVKFVCAVCRHVFTEHEARVNPFDPEEDQLRCPNCGSERMEPDHFDPDEPVEDPFETPEEGEGL